MGWSIGGVGGADGGDGVLVKGKGWSSTANSGSGVLALYVLCSGVYRYPLVKTVDCGQPALMPILGSVAPG